MPDKRDNKKKEGKRFRGGYKKRRFDKNGFTGDNATDLIDNPLLDTVETLQDVDLSLFKVTELLSEVTYSPTQRAAVEQSFTQLKECLLSAEPAGYETITSGIPSPFPEMNAKILSSRTFVPPADIELCGSFACGVALSVNMEVDVRLTIPTHFFNGDDYKDFAWLIAKSYYAAVLAQHVSKQREEWSTHYISPQDNRLDIGLSISIPGSITFRVLLGMKLPFSHERLKLRCHNLNVTLLPNEIHKEQKNPATPRYNMAVLSNEYYFSAENLIADWCRHDSVRDCMILLNVWLHQRQLDKGFGMLSAFILKLVFIYLIKKKHIKLQTSASLFTAFLQQIVSLDWTQPMTLCDQELTTRQLDALKACSPYVLVDPSGYVNVCADVQPHCLAQLQHRARESLTLLKEDVSLHFIDVFIKKAPHILYYDMCVGINELARVKPLDAARYLDYGNDIIATEVTRILEKLHKGLGNRVTRIDVLPVTRVKVPTSESTFPGEVACERLVIGMHIDLEHATSILIRGPPGDSPNAVEFRRFWGEKSELRRFMDGDICEAVVWQEGLIANKRGILIQIIAHVLQRHVGIEPHQVTGIESQLNSCLSVDNSGNVRNVATGEEESLQLLAAYNKLTQMLRSFRKQFDIKILDIYSPSLAFCHSEVFQPFKSKEDQPLPYQPYKVVMVADPAKWPAAQNVAKTLKMLLLVKLKGLLEYKIYNVLLRENALLIPLDGYLFEVQMANILEYNLMVDHHREPRQFSYYSVHFMIPRLVNSLRGVHHRNCCFGPAARLFKRWLGLNKLSSLISDLIADLLMAAVFENPQPFQAPRTPFVAFMRVLNLIAHFDWANDALILKFNFDEEDNENSKEAKNFLTALEDFKIDRHSFPPVTIMSPSDPESLLTRPLLAYKMLAVKECAIATLLAAESLYAGKDWSPDTFQAKLLSPRNPDVLDCTIELKPLANRRKLVTIGLSHNEFDVLMDPAEYFLEHLKNAYDDRFMLMYDGCDLRSIGLVWKPVGFTAQAVSNDEPEKMASQVVSKIGDDFMTKLDFDVLLEDLSITGQGVVSKITVHSPPPSVLTEAPHQGGVRDSLTPL